MKITASAKRCPECGVVTTLHAAECAGCGHRYRTRFAEPERTEAFDAVLLPRPPATLPHPSAAPSRLPSAHPAARPPAPLPPRAGSASFTQAFLGAFCLVASVGLGVWLTWGWSQGAGRRGVAPAASSARRSEAGGGFSFALPAGASAPASAGGMGRAEALYGRLRPDMSLYDVDQAAGGMGRVIRSAEPQTLRLAYDFPEAPGAGRGGLPSVQLLLRRAGSSGAGAGEFRVQWVALYHGSVRVQRRTGG